MGAGWDFRQSQVVHRNICLSSGGCLAFRSPPPPLAPVSRLIRDTVVSAGEIGPEQIHKPDSVPPFSRVAVATPTCCNPDPFHRESGGVSQRREERNVIRTVIMGFQLRITAHSSTLCESGAFTCQLEAAAAAAAALLPVTSEFSGCAVFTLLNVGEHSRGAQALKML